jgi:hypothetical protein
MQLNHKYALSQTLMLIGNLTVKNLKPLYMKVDSQESGGKMKGLELGWSSLPFGNNC